MKREEAQRREEELYNERYSEARKFCLEKSYPGIYNIMREKHGVEGAYLYRLHKLYAHRYGGRYIF